MVDGDKRVRAVVARLHEDVAEVPVQVEQTKVQQRNVVNFID